MPPPNALTNTNAVSQIFKEGGFVSQNRTKYLIIGGIVIAVVSICVVVFVIIPQVSTAIHGTPTPGPSASRAELEWTSCTYFIQRKLGISMGDAQQYNAGGVTYIQNGRYQVDVYYAKTNTFYRCVLQLQANGDSMLVSIGRR